MATENYQIPDGDIVASTAWLFHYDSRMVNRSLAQATLSGNTDDLAQFVESNMVKQANEIYSFPFLSIAFVNFLRSIADRYGKWVREEGDDFSAPEMRLRMISPALEDVFSTIMYITWSDQTNPLS